MNSLIYVFAFISFVCFSCKEDAVRERPSMANESMDDDSIKSLIEQMTLKENVSMVHGASGKDPGGVPYVGYLPGIKRLWIPSLAMQNGGSGAGASFANHRHKAPATVFPVSAAQASTWNRDLLYKIG